MAATNALLILFAALSIMPLAGAVNPGHNIIGATVPPKATPAPTVIAVSPSQMGEIITNGSFAVEPRDYFTVNGINTISVYVIHNGAIFGESSVTPYAMKKFSFGNRTLCLLYMTAAVPAVTIVYAPYSAKAGAPNSGNATAAAIPNGTARTSVPTTTMTPTTTVAPTSPSGIVGSIASFFGGLFGLH